LVRLINRFQGWARLLPPPATRGSLDVYQRHPRRQIGCGAAIGAAIGDVALKCGSQ